MSRPGAQVTNDGVQNGAQNIRRPLLLTGRKQHILLPGDDWRGLGEMKAKRTIDRTV